MLETDRLSAHDRAQLRGQLGRVFFSLGDSTAAAPEWELAIPDLSAGTFADAWAMIMLGWPSAGRGRSRPTCAGSSGAGGSRKACRSPLTSG